MKRNLILLISFLLLLSYHVHSDFTEFKPVRPKIIKIINEQRVKNSQAQLLEDTILNKVAFDYLHDYLKTHGGIKKGAKIELSKEKLHYFFLKNKFSDIIPSVYVAMFITNRESQISKNFKEDKNISRAKFNRIGFSVIKFKKYYYTYYLLSKKTVEIKLSKNEYELYDRFNFQGEILDHYTYKNPKIFVTLPSGTVDEIEVKQFGSTIEIDYDRFRKKGVYTFEVVLETDRGPEPTNIFDIYVQTSITRPESKSPSKQFKFNHLFPEEKMIKLVNKDRKRFNRTSLKTLPGLNDLARNHSKEMAEEGDINHISPLYGSVSDRLEAWFDYDNYVFSSIGENLSKAKSIEEGEESLMNSPGHRKNILDPDYNVIGIGITKGDDGYLYITQIFGEAKPFLDSEIVKSEFLKKLNKKRSDNNKKIIIEYYGLSQIADALKEKLVTNGEETFLKDFNGYVNEVLLEKGYEESLNFLFFTFINSEDLISDKQFLSSDLKQLGISILKDNDKKRYYGIFVLK